MSLTALADETPPKPSLGEPKSTEGDTTTLDFAEIQRYGRHLVLPEVGLEGQQRLKAAKVLLVGVGGLGSPASLYLTAAGVGTLGLVDFDTVEVSNLQRQVLYDQSDLGQLKVEAACKRLHQLNPHIHLVPHPVRLAGNNVLELLSDYDFVLDGSDNFETRYLVNDACMMVGKYNVWGAVSRFEGQVAIFGGADGPCYRCLFPEPPPPGLVPSCAEGGVLGVLPGMIGALQASEAIKLILGLGESLAGRLAIFDALRFRWRELRVARAEACPLCSVKQEQRRLIEVATTRCQAPEFTELHRQGNGARPQEETHTLPDHDDLPFDTTVQDLAAWLDADRAVEIIDVREPHEAQICHLEGSRLIPLRQLQERLGELDPKALTVVHCHHGPRSSHAVEFLRGQGFSSVTNLEGGIDAWSLAIDPSIPRY
jgi:adenylyltransferase/sulfurtransferase